MLYQNRREHIFGLGSSLGALAMTDLLAKDNRGPLAPKKPMHDAKAKAVIMLFMEGGPSQVDTFDPKPKLGEMHKKDTSPDNIYSPSSYYPCVLISPCAFIYLSHFFCPV